MTKPTRISDFQTTSSAPQATGSSPDEAPFSEDYCALDRVAMTVGPNATGFQIGRMTRMNLLSPTNIGTADFIAECVQVRSNSNASEKGVYVHNGAIWLQSGAVHSSVVGYNPQFIFQTGAIAIRRIGYRAQTSGDVQGSLIDAAITTYAEGAPWKDFCVLSEHADAQSISATGNLFRSHQAMTIGSIFNMPNVTVTGDIFNFPNARLTGDGNLFIAGTVNGGTGGGGGAYLSSDIASVSAIALTNVAQTTLTYIDFPVGEFDVSWKCAFKATGNAVLQQVASSVSLVNNTLDNATDRQDVVHWGTSGINIGLNNAIRSGGAAARFVITTANTRVYLVGLAQFPSGSGCNLYGKIWARRLG